MYAKYSTTMPQGHMHRYVCLARTERDGKSTLDPRHNSHALGSIFIKHETPITSLWPACTNTFTMLFISSSYTNMCNAKSQIHELVCTTLHRIHKVV